MDYGTIVKNSLAMWFKDSKTLRYMLVQYFLAIGIFVILGSMLFLVFGDLISLYTQANPSLDPNFQFTPEQLAPFQAAILSDIILFAVLLIPLVLVWSVLHSYISILIQVRALQVVGFQTALFNFAKWIKLAILVIFQLLLALTSWYHKKFRLVFFAIFGLGFFSIIGGFIFPPLLLLGLLALLLSIPYAVMFIHSALRLSMSSMVFLQTDMGIVASTKESWEITDKKTGNLLLVSLVFGIILWALSLFYGLFEFILKFLVGLVGIPIVNFGFLIILVPVSIILFSAMRAYLEPNIYADIRGQPSADPAQMQQKPQNQFTGAQSEFVSRREQRLGVRKQIIKEKMQQQSTSASTVNTTPGVPSSPLSPTDETNIEKLVKLLQPQVNEYSKDELVMVMNEKGYSKKVVAQVLKRIGK